MRNNSRLARLERDIGPDYSKIDVTQLSDAELDALIASLPPMTPEEQAWISGLTDDELEELIAGREVLR